MLRIKKMLLIFLLGIFMFSLVACNDSTKNDVNSEASKIIKVRINADIKNLDPARRYTQWDDFVSKTLFSGLITYSPNSYEIENDLAEELVFSEDGKEIYFKLREGVQFNGGKGEVTSDDVKYSYERFLDPDTASSFKEDWLQLDRVEIISKYEGKIILKDFFAPLENTTLPLLSGAIVPKNYVEKVGLDDFATKAIGSGPYYLADWQPDQKLVVKRNMDYFGEDPYWDEIHFIVITDDHSAEMALRAGEIDFGKVSPLSVELIKADEQFKVTDNMDLDYKWIGINVKNPKLEDVRVRKAIRYAVNIPEILEVAYDGQFEQANGIIAPGLLGYWEKDIEEERNIKKAKELMREAGVDSLELRMDIIDEAEYRAWAEIIRENLKEININLEISPLEVGTFWEVGMGEKGKDLELYSSSFQMQADPFYGTRWFTSKQVGNWNWMRWENERFDELHYKALVTKDEKERNEIYVEMQQVMYEDAAAIWVTHGKSFYAYNSKKLTPAMSPHNALQFADFGPGKE